MSTYSEALKDPRWQKRRLEILNRDKFTCKVCGCGLTSGTPLNVHHLKYIKGKNPWEYPDNYLITLCEECHGKMHSKDQGKAEPFFFTYPKGIQALMEDSLFGTTTKVLFKLLEYASYNKGKVVMDSEHVGNLLKDCKMSRVSYHRAINDLMARGIISKNKSTYTIKEDMFWKGDRRVRQDIINARLQVTFSPVMEEPDFSWSNTSEEETSQE